MDGAGPPLKIAGVTRLEDRVVAEMLCDRASSSAMAARRLLEEMPHLAEQLCVQGHGMRRRAGGVCSFGQVCCDTSLPHLAEHVALELMYRRASESGQPMKAQGFTKKAGFADDGCERFEVSLRSADLDACLFALEQAVQLVCAFC